MDVAHPSYPPPEAMDAAARATADDPSPEGGPPCKSANDDDPESFVGPMEGVGEPHASSEASRTGTTLTAVGHILTGAGGAGVLALPSSIAALGWVGGGLSHAFTSYVTQHTALLLADCQFAGGKRRRTFSEVARACFGRFGYVTLVVVQQTNLALTALAYHISAAQSFQALASNVCHQHGVAPGNCFDSYWKWALIFMGVQMLVVQLPDLNSFAWASIFGAAMTLGYSTIAFGLSVAKSGPGNVALSEGALAYSGGSTDTTSAGLGDAAPSGAFGIPGTPSVKAFSVLNALGSIQFAYSFAMILIEIMDTLAGPRERAEDAGGGPRPPPPCDAPLGGRDGGGSPGPAGRLSLGALRARLGPALLRWEHRWFWRESPELSTRPGDSGGDADGEDGRGGEGGGGGPSPAAERGEPAPPPSTSSATDVPPPEPPRRADAVATGLLPRLLRRALPHSSSGLSTTPLFQRQLSSGRGAQETEPELDRADSLGSGLASEEARDRLEAELEDPAVAAPSAPEAARLDTPAAACRAPEASSEGEPCAAVGGGASRPGDPSPTVPRQLPQAAPRGAPGSANPSPDGAPPPGSVPSGLSDPGWYERRVMRRAVTISVGTMTVFYLAVSIAGYIAFGSSVPNNILHGFSRPAWLINLANAMVIAQMGPSYQLYAQPFLAFAEAYWNTRRWAPGKGLPARVVGRTLFVALLGFLAICLPFFSDIVGLVGALGFWPLTIFFPIEIWIRCHHPGTLVRSYLRTLSLICCLATVAAVVGSIQLIVVDSASYRLFS